MKSFLKAFFMRGLVSFGFGPIVVAIIYLCLSISGVEDTLSLAEVAKQIILVSFMAFFAGGITAIYQIEKLPLPFAIIIQATVLYINYVAVYIVNGWLEKAFLPIAAFTVIFILGYAIIWAVVYLFTKKSAKKLNERLKN